MRVELDGHDRIYTLDRDRLLTGVGTWTQRFGTYKSGRSNARLLKSKMRTGFPIRIAIDRIPSKRDVARRQHKAQVAVPGRVIPIHALNPKNRSGSNGTLDLVLFNHDIRALGARGL